MRDPVSAILSAIRRDDGGIAILWCPADVGLRDWVISQVEDLGGAQSPITVRSVDEAMAEPDRLVLLVPADEVTAIQDLDASRDRIRSEAHPRSQPIVLFLMRGDAARNALANAVSLRSIASGNDPDPEELAEVDVPVERERFQREIGATPEQWLADWRAGTIGMTPQTFGIASLAKLLER